MRYYAWKIDENLEPIPDSERVLESSCLSNAIKFLCYEEGVEYKYYMRMVRTNKGYSWAISI